MPQDGAALASEAVDAADRAEVEDCLPPRRRFVWFLVVAIALVGVVFVKVPAYDYDRDGLRLTSRTVSELWWEQIEGLPDVAYDVLLTAGFIALIVIFLVAASIALWYALYPDGPLARAESVDDESASS
ncbi:MAG TPA: hypothetical protein VGR16_01490 [Thermomicrobiales bacterium]|nr:hypothetical protein [Thermomicrobiales bacterium]